MTIVAIIGLGEAGTRYAQGLRDTGFTVRGFDPFAALVEPGITQCGSLEEALSGADLALSLVGARAAERVAEEAYPALAANSVYADLNTAAPEVKRRMSSAAAAAGIGFADVAVLAPVPRAGVRTPLMASGSGAGELARLLGEAGASVEQIGGEAGDAAERKLLRSVFMKGLAAVVLESVAAAEAAGQGAWLREQMVAELAGNPERLIDRLVEGSRQHAARRAHETADAAAYLESLGTPRWTVEAARSWLTDLAEQATAGATAEPSAAATIASTAEPAEEAHH